MATVDDKKIIFSMVGVSKIIPQNQKQILKNIYPVSYTHLTLPTILLV